MANTNIATRFQHPVDPIFVLPNGQTNGFGEFGFIDDGTPVYHLGDDYWVAYVPVYPIANGYAVEIGYNASFGNYVVIRHDMANGQELYSLYAHLDSIGSYLDPDGQVTTETEITVSIDINVSIDPADTTESLGVSGNTGDGGVHLHLEIADQNLFNAGQGQNYALGYDPAGSPAFGNSVGLSADGDSVLSPGVGVYDPSTFIDTYSDPSVVARDYGSGDLIVFQPFDGKDTFIRSSLSNNGDYGLDSDVLNVVGWGDYYYSFIQFDLENLPSAADAVTLRLFNVVDNTGTGWTHPEMSLWTISGDWEEGLQWPDNTTTATYVRDLPAVQGVGYYDIDITEIYNQWQSGELENDGLQLRPQTNFANRTAFASSEYIDPDKRPALIIDPADKGSSKIQLSDVAAGVGGFKIIGENAGDSAGVSVSFAGDFNGDGFNDLLIGASGQDAGGDNAGAAYVVFGGDTFPATVDLNDVAAGIGGFKIIGDPTVGLAGSSVSPAGDVNGDGYIDLLISASGIDIGVGAAYVVFGADMVPAPIDLRHIAMGIGGFKISVDPYIGGVVVSDAGDWNGDGNDDFLIGVPIERGNVDYGAAYLVFGGKTAPVSLEIKDIVESNGAFKFGAQLSNFIGGSFSLGDFNGDGHEDIFVARHSGFQESDLGGPYLVLGSATPQQSIDLGKVAEGLGGFQIMSVIKTFGTTEPVS